MKLTKINSLLLLLFLATIACSKDDNPPSFQERGTLIEAVEKGRLTKSEVVERVNELDIRNTAIYDVSYHVITYRTEYNGEQIDTKGMLFLPEGVDSVYFILYCHGTQLPLEVLGIDKLTPSNYDGRVGDFNEVRNMGFGWSSAGYAVFIPDYIGYGATLGKDHPYVYYPEMFKSNIDGLLACKQFFANKNLPYDERLFITGWSQGGGACLSAHKLIQENYADEFTVVASSGLAGPYNFEGFVDNVFSRRDEEVNIAFIFSWAIYSMNKFSDLKRPTDQIYAYPVFDQVSALFTPSRVPDEFFNDFFISNIIDGTDTEFRAEMKKNSFHEGWLPVGKVFFHHGDADDVVPYFNSVDAQAGLMAAGADVKLYSYPGGKHDTELDNYISNTLKDFNELK